MNITHDPNNIRLTSAEIAQLWGTYITDSASKCMLSYFLAKAEDQSIRELVEYALGLSENHLSTIREVYKSVNHAIPYGFSDGDVNINAKRLFSDGFVLNYLKYAADLGLNNYSQALGSVARDDVRKFFVSSLQTSIELSNRATSLLLKKGFYIRPPYIEAPQKSEFVQKQSYIHGILGDKRPINAMEITQVHIHLNSNMLGKAFAMGLAQVAESEAVRKYINRGKEMSEKEVNILNDILKRDDIPYPTTWDSDVMGSQEAPFSDKLMIFHITALNAFSMALHGVSMAKNLRSDIAATLSRLVADIAQYAKDGLDIMIDNEWLEKVPEAVDRQELINIQ